MKKMDLRVSAIMVSAALLVGCAGSANHMVVSVNAAGDESLTCSQMNAEIIKSQAIIEGVNKDKDDVSGADVIDGILYFPFNLIAKSGNYSDALEAADGRIAHMQALRENKDCKVASDEDNKESASKLTRDLNELQKLHEDGTITEEEYDVARQKVLNSIGAE